MNNRSFQKTINFVFTLALVFGLLLPASTTLALGDFTPNDTRYLTSEQWNLDGTYGINAPAAWAVTNGSGVVVAVIDTGITDHEDLEGARILSGYDFITNTTAAGDGDGRDGDPEDRGDWCVPPFPADEIPSSWQGTHVAGIIGAWSNNNKGIAGINWAAQILPVRVSGKCGIVSVTDLMDGMNWAVGITSGLPANPNPPAKVLNVGVGVPGEACTTHQTAINNILATGAVIVAAAGDNNSATLDFPANCTGVISVAATDVNGDLASNSNNGPTVQISAPGKDVLSTNNPGDQNPQSVLNYYTTKSDTGIAAAHVSGVVSLMLSNNSGMTPSYILQILQATAKDFLGGGTCTTSLCGSGIVDAGEALVPDLVITNAFLAPLVSNNCPDSVSPPSPAYSPPSDMGFCMYMTVKNQGSKDSGSLVSRNVYVDRDPSTLGVEIDLPNHIYGRLYTLPDPDNDDPGDYHTDNQLAGISAGGVFTQGVKITNPNLLGPHTLYGYVDANGIVPEVFENNNNFLPPISTSGGTIISVDIGGGNQGNYPMVSGESTMKKYALDGGPVKISSNNGAKIVASLYQWRRRPGTTPWTGITQSMALPLELITNQYVMPRYDYTSPSTMLNQVLIANVDTVTRDITVKIGPNVMGTYTLAPSASQYLRYNGVVGGPVVVSSVAGAKIVASLYELVRDPTLTGWISQSEMMGMPGTQLSDKYLIPMYFGASSPSTLKPYLYIANADTIATTVEVKIAGLSRGTYPLNPNTSTVTSYPLDGGPVEISSNNGAKIVASLYQWRRRPGTIPWTGITQSMALPVELITDKYVMPRYDYTSPTTLFDQVLIANVDTVTRDITVKIGPNVMGTYTLAPSASQYLRYNGVVGGPVVVSSVLGAKIVASQYQLVRDPSLAGWIGQSEMMGLPGSQLSDKYLIPMYFGASSPNTLVPYLYISVP